METSTSSKTAASTPASSPGPYSPSPPPQRHLLMMGDSTPGVSPYLHPLQMHKVREVRETHKAQVEQDFITGRKLINQYEIIDEIGRGVHGKVKLARSLETSEYVAIKIIQRFSKKRRLGRVTVSPEDKTKREIAILKKVRHPNVVGLLEIIDDPELKKIYMVLEHVELGEIVWRKKGTPLICLYERRRIEREIRGDHDVGEETHYFKVHNDRHLRREAAREKVSKPPEYWSLEYGVADEDEMAFLSRHSTQDSLTYFAPRSYNSHTSMVRSTPVSGSHSRTTSRAPSRASSTAAPIPLPTEFGIGPIDSDNEDEHPGPLPSIPSNHSSAAALDAQNLGGDHFRGRSPSMADSIVSHMSSLDDAMPHDSFEEDFSYVPCFTIEQARSTFRDTVLGLEYLHYQGIVHRDIKPANLLWTKDHRVKISDFGVSYFGRPIRDGEAEEYISESDAQDFDDDLELAKTVGTPAFFAPELCYTDVDVEQPKVTEQIDVWSLGVTLYCLIYARIPFLAEDEYQLFRAIAHQDVYIPKRRLKAVNPSAQAGSQTSLPNRSALYNGPYRQDGELVLEDIDDELYDLLRRMLIKDPTERLKLREVKRHPWVLKGIDNVIGWLDDTDPSRKTAGRRIQVDDRELERAVVPITFLERARSAVKKAVGKVIGRGDGSRKRAVSSANSSGTSGTDTSVSTTPVTPMRDARRASLRGDESYFAAVRELREPGEHPLAQSVSASPEQPVDDNDPFAQQFLDDNLAALQTPRRKKSDEELGKRPTLQDRTVSTAASIQTIIRRLSHSRSFSETPQSATLPRPQSPESSFAFTDHNGAMIRDTSRSLSDSRNGEIRAQSSDATARTRSTDRALFNSNDKHSEPSVAMSNAIAPGNFEHPSPKRHLYTRSTEVSPSSVEKIFGLPPSHYFRSSMLSTSQQSVSETDVPNLAGRMYAASILEDRPSTATRTPEGRTPAPRVYHESTPESFARAEEQFVRRRKLEEERAEEEKEHARQMAAEVQSEAASTCPPSPDDDIFHQKQDEEAKRAKSSSSIGSVGLTSPITSPSDVTSPISSMNYSSANLVSSSDQTFPSDPSLPTLVSGASSVSADHEGDFLAHPGVVRDPVEVTGGTPDTLTPPLLSKEPSHDGELPSNHSGLKTLPIVADEDEGYSADGDLAVKTEDDDSDSDEGLTMSRKKPAPSKRSGTLVRRDTNASVGSTETAKKVSIAE